MVDLVQFVMGCDMDEALTYLTGVMPQVRQEWAAVDAEPARVPYLVRVKACTALYNECAELDEHARRYLEDKQGIPLDVAESFGLRVITQDRNAGDQSGSRAFSALMHAVGAEVAQALSLAKASGKTDTLYFPLWGHWLVIPYHDDTGAIGHLQFRRLHRSDESKSKGAKYRHVGGEVPFPWNYAACYGEGHPGSTFVVEGAMDALALEARNVPAIGVPGAQWMNADKAKRLADRATSTLIVGYDADEAKMRPDGTAFFPGADAQARDARWLLDAGASVRTVTWPEDWIGDWCEWFVAGHRSVPHNEPLRLPGSRSVFSLAEAIEDAAREQQAIASGRQARTLIEPGYGNNVDRILAAEPGEMTIVGARPHGGKTHLMLSTALLQARQLGKVGCLSLEMSRSGIGQRSLYADMGVSRDEWFGFSADKRLWMTQEALSRLEDYQGLHVVHPEKRGGDAVVAECERMIEQGCRVVWIDHVQHIARSGRESSWDVIDKTVKRLFALFQGAGVPWFLLVQLSRGIEKRANRAPAMSDIKGCGSLEEVADRIVTIGCPGEWEEGRDMREHELTKLKDRNGGVDIARASLALPDPFGWFVAARSGRL